MRDKFTYTVTFYNIPDGVDTNDPILFALRDYLEKTMRAAGFRRARARFLEAWGE